MQDTLESVKEFVDLSDCEFKCPDLNGQFFSESQMIEHLDDIDYLIAGDDEISEWVIKNSELAGVVKWGVGFDSIDTVALDKRFIKFSNTPGQFAEDVAEQAIGLMLAAERGVAYLDREIRNGVWLKHRGRRVSGKSALVLGFGSIGKSLCQKLSGLNLNVEAVDPFISSDTSLEVVLFDHVPFDRNYDYLFLALPLNSETKGLVGLEFLKRVIPGGILINVSRGGIVIERELVEGLSRGWIRGAGLDVFEREPLSSGSELATMNQVVLGSHNSSNTEEGVAEASIQAAKILRKFIDESK